MAKLTDKTLATGATLNDLVHIVITSDISQDPAGSSFKANLGQIGSAVGGYESYTAITITSSQILSAYTTPVEILPSPGVNNYYDAKYISEFTYNTSGITGGTAVITDSGLTQNYTISPLSNMTEDRISILTNTDNGSTLRMNSPMYFYVFGADPTGGDGEFLIKIWYTIRTFG